MPDQIPTDQYHVPPVPDAPTGRRKPRNAGARAGLVLIVIGAVILVAQFVPGLVWWAMWPLIIVVAGAVQAVTPGRDGWDVERLFDGLSTVAFGLFVLAITTGLVGWDVFWDLLRFWPVLIIALGLNLLGKGLNSSWVRALGSVAVIATLAFVVATEISGVEMAGIWRGPTFASGMSEVDITEPVETVQRATLKMDTGMVGLSVAEGTELVELTGTSPWGDPSVSVDRSGDTADVTLSIGDEVNGWVWPGDSNADLDLKLARDVVWDMELKAGVADLQADLSDLSVRAFELRPGVADCTVRFGEATADGPGMITVESGVSSVRLELPEGSEARIRSQSGLTGHDISDAFEHQGGGVWQTPGFGAAESAGDEVWLVEIKSGVGSIVVDTY